MNKNAIEYIKNNAELSLSYLITKEHFDNLVRTLILEDTGIDLGENVYSDVDCDTLFVRTIIEEDAIINDDIDEKLADLGYDFNEWYETTHAVITRIFGEEDYRCRIDLYALGDWDGAPYELSFSRELFEEKMGKL